MTPRTLDHNRWPLAPGNAPADVEAALQAEAQRWPDPTVELRDRVTAVLRRTSRAA